MHLRSGNREGERKLRLVLVLTVIFFAVEIAGGIASNSLALLSDAGHMLVDISALLVAIIASRQSRRRPDHKRTYGYRRIEVLAALGNGLLLALLAGAILREAWQRLARPVEVRAPILMVVAVAGLLINVIGLLFLRHERHRNINVRGAFLHVAGDAIGSIGAILAGTVIILTGWKGADAVASVLISFLILWGAGGLLRESLNYLLEGAPRDLHVPEVDQSMRRVPGVHAIHDLHLWRISSGMDILTAHVVLERGAAGNEVLDGLRRMLRQRFGLTHATLQLEEREGFGCGENEGEICDQI